MPKDPEVSLDPFIVPMWCHVTMVLKPLKAAWRTDIFCTWSICPYNSLKIKLGQGVLKRHSVTLPPPLLHIWANFHATPAKRRGDKVNFEGPGWSIWWPKKPRQNSNADAKNTAKLHQFHGTCLGNLVSKPSFLALIWLHFMQSPCLSSNIRSAWSRLTDPFLPHSCCENKHPTSLWFFTPPWPQAPSTEKLVKDLTCQRAVAPWASPKVLPERGSAVWSNKYLTYHHLKTTPKTGKKRGPILEVVGTSPGGFFGVIFLSSHF